MRSKRGRRPRSRTGAGPRRAGRLRPALVQDATSGRRVRYRARLLRRLGPPALPTGSRGGAPPLPYPYEVCEGSLVSTSARARVGRPLFRPSMQAPRHPVCCAALKRWGSGERFEQIISGSPRSRTTPRSVRRSSSAFPGETEADTSRCSASLDERASTGRVFFSRSPARTGPPRPDMGGMVADSPSDRAVARMFEVQEPITAAARSGAVGRRPRRVGRRPSTTTTLPSDARTARRPRSTASCASFGGGEALCRPGGRSCGRPCEEWKADSTPRSPK